MDVAEAHEHFPLRRALGFFIKTEETAINEIAGYQLACQIGLRVSESKWFATPANRSEYNLGLPNIEVGLLIKELTGLSRHCVENIAGSDPSFAAKYLAFCCFSAGEWPEIWRANLRHYAGDLEFLGNAISLHSEIPELELKLENYRKSGAGFVQAARDKAASLAIAHLLRDHLIEVCAKFRQGLLTFNFKGLDRAQVFEDYFTRSLVARISSIEQGFCI